MSKSYKLFCDECRVHYTGNSPSQNHIHNSAQKKSHLSESERKKFTPKKFRKDVQTSAEVFPKCDSLSYPGPIVDMKTVGDELHVTSKAPLYTFEYKASYSNPEAKITELESEVQFLRSIVKRLVA